MFYCFFFFQAEDGIRDLTVTGVQTCALPISRQQPGVVEPERSGADHPDPDRRRAHTSTPRCNPSMNRSEEHTSELQSQSNLVCRLLLEKKKKKLSPPTCRAPCTPSTLHYTS